MKNLVFFVITLIISTSFSFSQNSNKKIKPYKVWVTQLDGKIYKGFLYSADEDEIVITVNYFSTETIYTIEYSKIKMIKWRRKGSVGRTALLLGGAGVIILGGSGYAAGDDPKDQWLFRVDKEEKALSGAIVGGILGGGFGALIGTIKEKMIINGDIENYKRYLPKLKKGQIKPE